MELGKLSRNEQMLVVEYIIISFLWALALYETLNLTPKNKDIV